MPRWFNVAGPCDPRDHYMLPATARLPEVMRLIRQKSYFVLHAPRQTGKTTAMLSLAQELTIGGQWTAALLSVEVGAPFNDDPGRAEAAILDEWQLAARLACSRPWRTYQRGVKRLDSHCRAAARALCR